MYPIYTFLVFTVGREREREKKNALPKSKCHCTILIRKLFRPAITHTFYTYINTLFEYFKYKKHQYVVYMYIFFFLYIISHGCLIFNQSASLFYLNK